MKYQIGDKVRIVPHWGEGCHQNKMGLMDKYLGTVMTIAYAPQHGTAGYKMIEDTYDNGGFGWLWNECIFDGIADEVEVDYADLLDIIST